MQKHDVDKNLEESNEMQGLMTFLLIFFGIGIVVLFFSAIFS